jgi:signal transduction histidine kinase
MAIAHDADTNVLPLSATTRERLYLFGFVCILLISVLAFAYAHYSQVLKDTEALLNSIATQKVKQILQWKQIHINEAREFVGSQDHIYDISRLIENNSKDSFLKVAESFQNLKETYGYSASMVLNTDLVNVMSTDSSIGIDSSLNRYFTYSSVIRNPVLTHIYNIPPEGFPGLNIVIPIFVSKAKDAPLLGYVVHFIEAHTNLYPIISEWPIASKSGESLLLRKINSQVQVIGNLKLLCDSALTTLWPEDGDTIEVKATRAEQQFLIGKNYYGRPAFAVARKVPGNDWILVSEITRKEVFQPWLIIFILFGIILIAGIATAVLTGIANLHVRSSRRYKQMLETEKNLRSSEKKFTAFMDRMPSLVLIKDSQSRILFANKAIRDLFPVDGWIGKTPDQIFDPAQAETTLFWDVAALEKGYVEYEEMRKNKFGIRIHLLTQKFKILLDDGAPLIGQIMTDMTEKGQAVRQLRELNDNLEYRVKERTSQLEKTNAELQTFVYAVSHDLRSPLRSLEGFAELLNERYGHNLDENGRHYLDRIRKASHRMTSLINDLIDLSKVSNVEIKRGTVDIGNIAHGIVSEHIKKYPKRVVSISIKPSMITECDATLAEAMLRHLLDNTFKFSSGRPKTVIDIGTTTRHPSKPGSLLFYIKDNGIGFDMAFAKTLFEPFHRLHGVDEFPGNGIGLSIVKRVVDRHNGSIWLESELGVGTTVFFTLNPE